MIRLYQDAEAFVFPAVEEAFGMSLLEAMACGCACIVTDREPMNEIIHNAGVLCDMSDARILAEKIREILHNNALRELLRKKARQRAIELFHADIVHKQFHDIVCSYIGT